MENCLYIPIPRLQKICDPFECAPWGCGPVTKFAVDMAIELGHLNPNSNDSGRLMNSLDHADRIAYLVVNGWDDAIDIDVGMPHEHHTLVSWPVEDGNHRLAAAIYRGDETIKADVAGCNEYMLELFGVCYPDDEPLVTAGMLKADVDYSSVGPVIKRGGVFC